MKDLQLEVVYLDPKTLIPYEKNAKIHNKKQIEALSAAIVKRGFDQPVTVDKDMVIITGHGRTEAAIFAGLSEIPVIIRSDLTDTEVAAKRLEDNRLASTDYDMELLEEEINEILSADRSENLFGFDDKELQMMTEDLLSSDLGEEMLISDVSMEASRIAEENEEIGEEIAESKLKISDAFGFREVPMKDGRTIIRWVAMMEELTGRSGAAALVEYAKRDLAKAEEVMDFSETPDPHVSSDLEELESMLIS
ncbi:ParB/Srx family N-terminal domain-containing protein [Photobacterium ganghwense]|uniref:ParB/Srx family N-terminal domain-containing protein n=1 Tax=Photobacterium ganghwense TaxID=320778 RepID=UPI001A9022F3|nr:ParB/Srx family N-terminal domain-containing protein [Photobacterium ganghwense]QSV17168.1 ParB N-terminal domain-containing protein [Photobacterium ganghwense]